MDESPINPITDTDTTTTDTTTNTTNLKTPTKQIFLGKDYENNDFSLFFPSSIFSLARGKRENEVKNANTNSNKISNDKRNDNSENEISNLKISSLLKHTPKNEKSPTLRRSERRKRLSSTIPLPSPSHFHHSTIEISNENLNLSEHLAINTPLAIAEEFICSFDFHSSLSLQDFIQSNCKNENNQNQNDMENNQNQNDNGNITTDNDNDNTLSESDFIKALNRYSFTSFKSEKSMEEEMLVECTQLPLEKNEKKDCNLQIESQSERESKLQSQSELKRELQSERERKEIKKFDSDNEEIIPPTQYSQHYQSENSISIKNENENENHDWKENQSKSKDSGEEEIIPETQYPNNFNFNSIPSSRLYPCDSLIDQDVSVESLSNSLQKNSRSFLQSQQFPFSVSSSHASVPSSLSFHSSQELFSPKEFPDPFIIKSPILFERQKKVSFRGNGLFLGEKNKEGGNQENESNEFKSESIEKIKKEGSISKIDSKEMEKRFIEKMQKKSRLLKPVLCSSPVIFDNDKGNDKIKEKGKKKGKDKNNIKGNFLFIQKKIIKNENKINMEKESNKEKFKRNLENLFRGSRENFTDSDFTLDKEKKTKIGRVKTKIENDKKETRRGGKRRENEIIIEKLQSESFLCDNDSNLRLNSNSNSSLVHGNQSSIGNDSCHLNGLNPIDKIDDGFIFMKWRNEIYVSGKLIRRTSNTRSIWACFPLHRPSLTVTRSCQSFMRISEVIFGSRNENDDETMVTVVINRKKRLTERRIISQVLGNDETGKVFVRFKGMERGNIVPLCKIEIDRQTFYQKKGKF